MSLQFTWKSDAASAIQHDDDEMQRGADTVNFDKALLEQLTAVYKTPLDVDELYSQMLQHMINRLAGVGDASAPGP